MIAQGKPLTTTAKDVTPRGGGCLRYRYTSGVTPRPSAPVGNVIKSRMCRTVSAAGVGVWCIKITPLVNAAARQAIRVATVVIIQNTVIASADLDSGGCL